MIRTLVRIVTTPAMTLASLAFDALAALSYPMADQVWSTPRILRPEPPHAHLLEIEENEA